MKKLECFRFRVFVTDGYFYLDHPKPSGWTHLTLNCIGPENGQGIRIYYDGEEVKSDTTKHSSSRLAGDGRIVVGRFYTDQEKWYASLQLDELIFFNQSLTSAEVKSIFNSV